MKMYYTAEDNIRYFTYAAVNEKKLYDYRIFPYQPTSGDLMTAISRAYDKTGTAKNFTLNRRLRVHEIICRFNVIFKKIGFFDVISR